MTKLFENFWLEDKFGDGYLSKDDRWLITIIKHGPQKGLYRLHLKRSLSFQAIEVITSLNEAEKVILSERYMKI